MACTEACDKLSEALKKKIIYTDLLNTIQKVLSKDLTYSQWRLFGETFGADGEQALEIVDQKGVVSYSDGYTELHHVTTKCDIYSVLLKLKWCSCPMFDFYLTKNNTVCPHVLACIFAEALGKVHKFPTPSAHMIQMLEGLDCQYSSS